MAARARSFRLESPAPARSTGAPTAPPAVPERARPLHAGRLLGLPLTGLHLRRLDELEQLVGERYRGWGREGMPAGRDPNTGEWIDATWGEYFVDVADVGVDLAETKSGDVSGITRYTGPKLHQAIGAAIRGSRP